LTLSLWEFIKSFHLTTGRITRSYVLNNPLLERGKQDMGIIDKQYLSSGSCNMFKLSGMEFNDFWDDLGFRTMMDLNENKELNLSMANYFRSSLLWNKNRFLEMGTQGCLPSVSIVEFLSKFKKGSKHIREVFKKPLTLGVNLFSHETSKTFFRLTSISKDDIVSFDKNIGLWSLYFLPNKIKELIFKFYNNCLVLNSRIGNFLDVSKNCTFCELSGGIQHEESFRHFFLECE